MFIKQKVYLNENHYFEYVFKIPQKTKKGVASPKTVVAMLLQQHQFKEMDEFSNMSDFFNDTMYKLCNSKNLVNYSIDSDEIYDVTYELSSDSEVY